MAGKFKRVLLSIWSIALLVMTSEANPVLTYKPYEYNPCKIGRQYYPHPDYCTKFFHCSNGIPVEKSCAAGTVFNEKFSVCVFPGSEMDECTPKHPERECMRKTVDLIPHPTRCEGYYNCTDYVPYSIMNIHWSRGYEKECEFPKMFEINQKKCVGYEHAVCGPNRHPDAWQCDYYAYNMCPGMCRPCWVDYPSCVGKGDGLWPVPFEEKTNHLYMECKDQRDFKGVQFCGKDKVFDAIKRQCVYENPITTVPPTTKSGIEESQGHET